ncbi:MAG: hypothetical protein JNM66_14485 [Bryobacterales bacterium]|nr:hypothetical protein [Bryobacterales bacterium]
MKTTCRQTRPRTKQADRGVLHLERLVGRWLDRLTEWRSEMPAMPQPCFGLTYQDTMQAENFRRLVVGSLADPDDPDEAATPEETEVLLLRAGANRWAGIETLILTAPELNPFERIDPGALVNGLVDFVLRQRLGTAWPGAFDSRVATLAARGWSDDDARRIARAEYSMRSPEGLTEPPRLRNLHTRAERWGRLVREYPGLHSDTLPAIAPWVDEDRVDELRLLLSNIPTRTELERWAAAGKLLDLADIDYLDGHDSGQRQLADGFAARQIELFRERAAKCPIFDAAAMCAANPEQIDATFAAQLYSAVLRDLLQVPPFPPLFDPRSSARESAPLPPVPVLVHWARAEAAPFVAPVILNQSDKPQTPKVTIQ